jgi:hypothetical protein
MRQYGVIVVAVVVMVLVASCGPKAQETKDAGTGDAGKVAAPAPDQAAAPAPAAAPAATEGGPKVTLLGVGDKIDPTTQKVTHEAREFTSATPFIYIFVDVNGLTVGQKVRGMIHLVDGKAKTGEEMRDTDVSWIDIAAPQPQSHFNLKLGPQPGGWAVGKYELRLSADGKVFDTEPLTVK